MHIFIAIVNRLSASLDSFERGQTPPATAWIVGAALVGFLFFVNLSV